jgi:hypothetical protein
MNVVFVILSAAKDLLFLPGVDDVPPSKIKLTRLREAR